MNSTYLSATILLAATLGGGCTQGANIEHKNASILTPSAIVVSRSGWTARADRVASIAARAQKCGIAFDAAKLKASYLTYETKERVDAPQSSAIENRYDTTLKTVATETDAISNPCGASQHDSNNERVQKYRERIEAQLRRYEAGSFSSDEASAENLPFEVKRFWKDQDDN